jgi:hypothetical protein
VGVVNGARIAENVIVQIVHIATKKSTSLAQIMKRFAIHVVDAIIPHAQVVAMQRMITQDVKIAEQHIVTQTVVGEMV